MTKQLYHRLARDYDIEAMERLAASVANARVVWPTNGISDSVHVTVDGIRQVIKARQGYTGEGFDLWQGAMKTVGMNRTFKQAAAFLTGAPMARIRAMEYAQ